ncbi:hypothetical protein J4E91_007402 [Alternaria rosae]|nr:hypothetical protein J4E91_007402 [Alternaria rosae]
MASATQTELRAKFLQEAAHLLAIPSPTTAAFLGNACNNLIEDAEVGISSKETDTFRRSICVACGNVMIPGWSCKVSSRDKRKSIGKKLSVPEKTPTTTKKEDDAAPKTINASSKQRQRARKGGLQAMLDKKKTQDSGTGGLDFMDFAL